MEEELDRILMEYTRKFGDGFPTFQLFRGQPVDECIEMVKRCLDAGKDTYDLGLVTDEMDRSY